jgi:hypothetical protein
LHEDARELAHDLPTDIRRADRDPVIAIQTWDKLLEPVRAGIVAMVKAVSGK